MTYTAVWSALVCSFCTGGAAGCLLRMLLVVLFRHRRLAWRFTVMCILLSIAVTAATFWLFSASRPYQAFFTKHVVEWCVICAACGAVIFFFALILVPAAVVLYCFFSFSCVFSLHQCFGTQPRVHYVAFDESSVTVDGVRTAHSASMASSLSVQYCTLSPFLMIPGPHVWYVVSGTQRSTPAVLVPSWMSFLCGPVRSAAILPPSDTEHAALYTFTVKASEEIIVPVFVRVR